MIAIHLRNNAIMQIHGFFFYTIFLKGFFFSKLDVYIDKKGIKIILLKMNLYLINSHLYFIGKFSFKTNFSMSTFLLSDYSKNGKITIKHS